MKLQQLVNKCISVNYLEKHFLFSVMQNFRIQETKMLWFIESLGFYLNYFCVLV